MSDVVSLKAFKKRKTADQAKAKTLCRNGHHQWRVSKEKQFDVKQGKLVTEYRCQHCGKSKVKAE